MPVLQGWRAILASALLPERRASGMGCPVHASAVPDRFDQAELEEREQVFVRHVAASHEGLRRRDGPQDAASLHRRPASFIPKWRQQRTGRFVHGESLEFASQMLPIAENVRN
jgi:hypothetical protein